MPTNSITNSLSDKKPRDWKTNIIISGIGATGAIIVSIVDLGQNGNASTIKKLEWVISQHLIQVNGLTILVLVALIGAFLCFVYEPKSKVDGLARGLATLTLLGGFFSHDPEYEQEPDHIHVISEPIQNYSVRINFAIIQTNQRWSESNATIISNEWISEKKPEYSGPFGLGTFFNNKMNYSPIKYSLKKGARIRIIEIWDTNIRDYRYLKIQYKKNGKFKTGWIYSGKKPNFWRNVTPDNFNKPFLDQLIQES